MRISYILPIHIYIYIYVPVYTYKQLKQNLFYDDIKMAPDLELSSVEWANNKILIYHLCKNTTKCDKLPQHF